jgi:DNA-binding beta-propeller fold protein YncE
MQAAIRFGMREGCTVTFTRLAFAVFLFALPSLAAAAPGHRPAPVSYAAPAGAMPAGHLRGATFDAVLPSGRLVTPAGENVVTGIDALGVALTPDGRFAIVTCGDADHSALHSLVDPSISGGFALAVVDTVTMRVIDRYQAAGETFWLGVAALPDPAAPSRTLVLAAGGPTNAVYVFTLDATGRLVPDRRHTIAIPSPIDPALASLGHASPGTLTVSRDGRRAYVVNEAAATVAAIDTRARSVSGPLRAVGFAPFGAAIAGDRLLVSDEGLMRYTNLAQASAVPTFRAPEPDPQHASALTLLGLAPNGDLSSLATDAPPFANAPLPMDPAPDGTQIVGGAHPTAIVATADGAYAFVAMSGVDRIATVALQGAPRVVGGTELRLFDRGPYGMQPAALALSHDGTRLYVALAGIDAVAVIDAHDPVHLHRLGLIPTGWFPSALALAADDRALYVVNTNGFGHDPVLAGEEPTATPWSTLQRIDLGTVHLATATLHQLANTRRVVRTASRYPKGLTHVVVILEEDKTFDAMLGDVGPPDGDAARNLFGRDVTPNLHALARRYALAANFFADADGSGPGHQYASAGLTTPYSMRALDDRLGRTPHSDGADDPEDAPRLGSIFNALARHRIGFRDYGDLLRLSGYESAGDGPHAGIGGWYGYDVPAPAVLDGNVDLQYPGWNPHISDDVRAAEFVRDYAALAARGRQPRYTQIWLPGDRGVSGAGLPPVAEQVAAGDRALGLIVQYLSRLPSWKHTVVFIMPADTQSTRDHVDPARAYAIVAGPFAKPHYRGRRHLSTVSVLKTSEQILGAGILSLGDLLAADLSDFFTGTHGDARPYAAIAVPQTTANRSGP